MTRTSSGGGGSQLRIVTDACIVATTPPRMCACSCIRHCGRGEEKAPENNRERARVVGCVLPPDLNVVWRSPVAGGQCRLRQSPCERATMAATQQCPSASEEEERSNRTTRPIVDEYGAVHWIWPVKPSGHRLFSLLAADCCRKRSAKYWCGGLV